MLNLRVTEIKIQEIKPGSLHIEAWLETRQSIHAGTYGSTSPLRLRCPNSRNTFQKAAKPMTCISVS